MQKDILYPLRKLHGQLHEFLLKCRYALTFILPLKKKVFVVGTPVYSNLGDSAIVLAEIEFLHKCGYNYDRIKEITVHEYNINRKFFRRIIGNKHLICGVGGGNMGNQWRGEDEIRYHIIEDFPKNQIIIFPQTIYFTNDEKGQLAQDESIRYYNNKSNLTLIAREKTSFDIMSNLYPDTRILFAPDIVLSSNADAFRVVPNTRESILLCFREDAEKSLQESTVENLKQFLKGQGLTYKATDMHKANFADTSQANRSDDVSSKIAEFTESKLVITDRLHGMIFAAVTETPCIVFSNYNHKIRGTYELISYLPYIKYANSIDEAKKFVPELLNMSECKFDNSPIAHYYDKIAEVIKDK